MALMQDEKGRYILRDPQGKLAYCEHRVDVTELVAQGYVALEEKTAEKPKDARAPEPVEEEKDSGKKKKGGKDKDEDKDE